MNIILKFVGKILFYIMAIPMLISWFILFSVERMISGIINGPGQETPIADSFHKMHVDYINYCFQ